PERWDEPRASNTRRRPVTHPSGRTAAATSDLGRSVTIRRTRSSRPGIVGGGRPVFDGTLFAVHSHMRVAYLALAHANPRPFARLVRALQTSRARMFVHI